MRYDNTITRAEKIFALRLQDDVLIYFQHKKQLLHQLKLKYRFC